MNSWLLLKQKNPSVSYICIRGLIPGSVEKRAIFGIKRVSELFAQTVFAKDCNNRFIARGQKNPCDMCVLMLADNDGDDQLGLSLESAFSSYSFVRKLIGDCVISTGNDPVQSVAMTQTLSSTSPIIMGFYKIRMLLSIKLIKT